MFLPVELLQEVSGASSLLIIDLKLQDLDKVRERVNLESDRTKVQNVYILVMELF